MTAAQLLVERAFADAAIRNIKERHRRAASEFLRAYRCVAESNPSLSPDELCELAEAQLDIVVDPILTWSELDGVKTAKQVLLRLAK